MNPPVLDPRAAPDFFGDAIKLAEAYCRNWNWPPSSTFPSGLPAADVVGKDPGLLLLKQFSLLAQYLADIENALPLHWQLAFYRLLDMDLRTAAPAFAPLQFTPVKGQPPLTVPEGTAVLDTATQTIRFETDADLRVVPATVCAALTVAPALDRYIDCAAAWKAGDPAPLFCGASIDSHEKPLAHWFLIGDAALFKPDPAVRSITIELTGERLERDFFRYWCDGTLAPLDVTAISAREDGRGWRIDLKPLPLQGSEISVADLNVKLCTAAGRAVDGADIAGYEGAASPCFWLLVRPADHVRVVPTVYEDYLPKIQTLSCTVRAEGAIPQAAANNVPLDLTKGAYPFGKRPAVDDAFYVGCDSAFAHAGGIIMLKFALSESGDASGTDIDWQYWDGDTQVWVSFVSGSGGNPYGLADDTTNLSHSGTVVFVCPKIGMQQVAGKKGYWIRAVLKSYENPSGFSYQPLASTIDGMPGSVLPDTYKQPVIDYLKGKGATSLSSYQASQTKSPPYIESLKVDYCYSAEPAVKWRHDAFRLESLPTLPCRPYAPLTDEPSAFYLGFDYQDFVAHCLGEDVSLYFEIENERVGDGAAQSWQWLDYSNQTWQPLEIDDKTAGLARSGSVRFTVPDQMRNAICFSQRACWLRVLGARRTTLVLATGTFPNTTGAFNVTTYSNVVIGSGVTNQPDQTFLLPYAGVHEMQPGEMLPQRNVGAQDIELQVLEPVALDGKLSPELADQLKPIQWTRVDSFVNSNPHSRVYQLEGRSGTIQFGDGARGMIPPGGVNNIIAKSFTTTHGVQGNVDVGKLGLARAGIPGIAAVTNPVAARGGVDGDTLDDLAQSGPAVLRANDRIVTLGDFEAIAEAASARVCRVVAIERTIEEVLSQKNLGAYDPAIVERLPFVELVVLAMSDETEARTAPSVLDDVSAYVKARCAIQLQSRIMVRTPVFTRIDVAVVIQTNKPSYEWKDLQKCIVEQLTGFLHPVQGNIAGVGWPFGRPVPSTAVHDFLLGLTNLGVTGVGPLTLCGKQYQVELADDSVPCPGTIDVQIEAG